MGLAARARPRPPAFRIAARAILELGAELISSDGVALYELLKNSVDAGSAQVRIEIVVALGHTAYSDLLDRIDREVDRLEGFEGTTAERRRLEAESVADLRRLVLEALEDDAPRDAREAYSTIIDRCRTLVVLRRSLERFYDRVNRIEVSDGGEGMSLADLSDVYLTIGTRSRQKVKAAARGGKPDRVYLGEKGVGRLSTMRLGRLLRVETSRADEARLHLLDIDWDWFSHDSDKMLGDIKIRPQEGPRKPDRNTSGTKVTLRRLRSDWSRDKFARIVVEEFSKLIDPFESRRAGRLLRLYYNGQRQHVPEIERSLLDLAHAECSAKFTYENSLPVMRGFVNYRLRGRERSFVLSEPELRSAIGEHSWRSLLALGAFELSFWWFNRAALTDVAGFGKKADIRARVRRWSGGLMLFRDGFRINPYGSHDDDWLGLDKKAFSARGFKLNRQQVVGRVNISWRNRGLIEQTNREGLTETPEKQILIDLLQQVLFKEFKPFLDKCDEEVRFQEGDTLEDLQAKVEKAQDAITRKIREIVVRVPAEKGALGEIERLVKTLNEYVDQARGFAEEYQSDRAKFTYLAGIGLMVEFVLHELGRATGHTLETLKSLERQAEKGNTTSLALLPSSLRTLDDQLSTIVKRVETLDPLSTSRRQRKEDFSVPALVTQIVEGRQDQSRRHGVAIEVESSGHGEFKVRGVPGMFIQIMENLLSNSFYWIDVQRDIEPGHRAFIRIEIDADDKTITVTDNGTGVEPTNAGEIFDAFVSHRPARDGKGLGLYISREIASYHEWTIDIVRENTVRRGRYNTFLFDVSATAT